MQCEQLATSVVLPVNVNRCCKLVKIICRGQGRLISVTLFLLCKCVCELLSFFSASVNRSIFTPRIPPSYGPFVMHYSSYEHLRARAVCSSLTNDDQHR